MKLGTLFLFSTCFISCSSTYGLDKKKEFEALDEELRWFKPAARVDYLKTRVVNAEEKVHVCEVKLKKKLKEKDVATTNAKKYFIPLTVRDFAIGIENECPTIMEDETFKVPDDVWTNTPVHDKHEVKRTYKWEKLLILGKGGGPYSYFDPLVKELNKNFMIENNVEKIDKNDVKYKDYRLAFCKSVVKVIEYSNKITAHSKNDTGVLYDIAAVDKVVDKYTTMFYNVVVGNRDDD